MGANSEALWNFSPEESQKELQQGYTVGFLGRAFAQLIHINEHLIYAVLITGRLLILRCVTQVAF